VGNSKQEMADLHRQVLQMLSDFGFDQDLYIITLKTDSVNAEFDDKGAVEYFIKQCDLDHPDVYFVEYVKNGKRHVARVQYW
jgi:hypothetical protein